MGARKPLTDDALGVLAGLIASAILNDVEDARTAEVLARWDEIKELMPLAFTMVKTIRDALLEQGVR